MPTNTSLTTCTGCNNQFPHEEIYVLRHAGPKYSLRPFCGPCADKALAEWRASAEFSAWVITAGQ